MVLSLLLASRAYRQLLLSLGGLSLPLPEEFGETFDGIFKKVLGNNPIDLWACAFQSRILQQPPAIRPQGSEV